ncbi:MAG TPA: glycoside hydrolase family protein [Caulobacteraceae bacterium]|jgi:lysozyme|nr:glycoside hydrolase family protein [Caulobacteraceae bacterium]
MTPRHRVSPAAIALIKRFEGLRPAAVQLDDGRWIIGYGHTRSAREGAQVTEQDADDLLTYDLAEVQAAIDELVFTPLTQNQFDALASFVFNIGIESFRHSSVLRRLNEGALLRAACAMEIWRKADFEGERIVVDALVRRRAAEKALFLTPDEGFIAAPSAVVQPQIDYDVVAMAPRARQPELKTSLEGATPPPVGSRPVVAGDETPSSSERAAAAVTARLKAILPDEAASEDPEPFPSQPTPEPALVAPRLAEPARPDATEAARASVRSIFDQTRDEPERAGIAPLAGLGVIGFSLFAGGLYWAFVSKPSSGVLGSPIIGFALGFLGIVCVGSAVYFLLERLGGGQDRA